ncbi:ferric reductase transmembrane component 4 [Fusarium austroafricanum]|uniref:Ferric reductase transmembrane component 4 n=1 Tax=Fusarium austroafricanum TaxID=2364996 RepID=A0A8H4JCQ7_9HYPO|nr:ferric reductase transmembrane component 4 [Fusarium austroafricanum]
MPSLSSLLVAVITAANMFACAAVQEAGIAGHGLIGYGITMYKPLCAYSCRVVLSGGPLECSTIAGSNRTGTNETSPSCYATDDAFLMSMALCIKSVGLRRYQGQDKIADSIFAAMRYAYVRNTHRRLDEPGVFVMADPPVPKWTYQETLSRVNTTPAATVVYKHPLNEMSAVSDYDYQLQHNTMGMFENMEATHEKYGIVLIVCGAVVPLAASLLRFVPLPRTLVSKFHAVFIDPPLLGRRHKAPYFNMVIMPTRGQAILIAYVVAINVVLSAVGYESAQPNAWWFNNKPREILVYFGNRVGVLSFANVPLLILYAGRNNFLYWVTDWTQSTFMLLHRWTAYMCTLQAILHSIAWLRIYVDLGKHDSESQLPYWIWGIVATLAMSILLPASVIPFRQKLYEVFFAWHLVLTVLALVGSYLHIVDRFGHQWGYEVWMYISFAVWGFDRVARLVRMAKNGLRWATISTIDEEYSLVEVEGAVGTGHAYLYFPTLTWRVWESHPFSILGARLKPANGRPSSTRSMDAETPDADSSDSRKTDSLTGTTPGGDQPRVGLTFLVRSFTGATRLLRSHSRLPVFVEADYLPHPDLAKYQTLVCIVGGVAITAVTPVLHSYPGHAKLYWSSRTAELVQTVGLDPRGPKVLVGRRHQLRNVLEKEVGKAKGEMAVLVSGPASMADEVRCIVSELALRSPIPITLIDETYIW